MIPTLITVLLVKAGTKLPPPPPKDGDSIDQIIDHSTSKEVEDWLLSCKTVFDTGTKKHTEVWPEVLENDLIAIDSIQSIQSMVTPPASAFLPGWWDDVGWNDISWEDMLEIHETTKRLIAEMTEEDKTRYKDQAYFTVSFIGFWEVETSRDFESQGVDVDAVSFAREGHAVFKP